MHIQLTHFRAVSVYLGQSILRLTLTLARDHLLVNGYAVMLYKLTVTTTCSFMVNGPVLKVQRTPKVLKTLIGTTRAQRHPIGYTALWSWLAILIYFYCSWFLQLYN
jgi:hypothetical protein